MTHHFPENPILGMVYRHAAQIDKLTPIGAKRFAPKGRDNFFDVMHFVRCYDYESVRRWALVGANGSTFRTDAFSLRGLANEPARTFSSFRPRRAMTANK